MPTPLHVLIAEDRPADAELMVYELSRSGFEPDVSFYRDNYVSMPAGRKPADFYDQSKENRQRPLVSLANSMLGAQA